VIADRTACSILTLFIVIATSRPLNKKSLCCQCQSADPTITADLRPQSAVRTRLLNLYCSRTVWPFTAPCHCWQTSLFDSQSESHRRLWCFSPFLWRILWLNDTYSKSVWRDEYRNLHARNTLEPLLALYTDPKSHNAQRYRQTDRQTDRRTNNMMMPISDRTV